MTEHLLAQEPLIRLGVFLAVLVLMVLGELAAPRRRVEIPRLLRWSNNLAIVMLDALIVRLSFPIAAVGLAVLGAQQGWGLFNLVALPGWLAVVLSLIILDLAIYLQHIAFHRVPALWRLHRMHHADLEFDVTTGLRFHPLEILISMAIKMGLVVVLGVPAIAILIFEVLLNATAMFSHSNLALPARFDRWLRLLLVTPDMHRVHHSTHPAETHSNFGFNLSWWDRLLGTYIAQPRAGHSKMHIGLNRFRNQRELWLDRMLLQPLQDPAREPPADNEG